MSTLSSGIAACTKLHGFRLSLLWMDGEQREPETSEDAQIWSMAVNLLSFIHAEEIKHLSLCYWESSWPTRVRDTDPLPQLERLPWEKLNTVCRQFLKLQSMKVFFAEQEFWDGIGVGFAHRKLPGFAGILQRGDLGTFLMCEQEGCRWYKQY